MSARGIKVLCDGRPCFPVPRKDAPFSPIVSLLDEILGDKFPELPPKGTRGERYRFEELIERHIAFVDDEGREVRLPSRFVWHFIVHRRYGGHRL
jgi:hypothetical protein